MFLIVIADLWKLSAKGDPASLPLQNASAVMKTFHGKSMPTPMRRKIPRTTRYASAGGAGGSAPSLEAARRAAREDAEEGGAAEEAEEEAEGASRGADAPSSRGATRRIFAR